MLSEQRVIARSIDQRAPLFFVPCRQIQAQPGVDIDKPCDVFRTFHIATHPVQSIGDAAQHDNTHVSLLPPPCEEFTTREPFFSATRVKPPGRTKISFPYRTYGRRSTCRPSKCSATITGTRDRARVG